MPLSITSATRHNGAQCDHITVSVDHEGTARTFNTSFKELDQLIDDIGGEVAAQKALIMLWAAYRRAKSRAIVNVVIA